MLQDEKAVGFPRFFSGLWRSLCVSGILGTWGNGRSIGEFPVYHRRDYADEMGIPQKQPESPVFGKCPVPAGILRLPVRVRNGEMGRDL